MAYKNADQSVNSWFQAKKNKKHNRISAIVNLKSKKKEIIYKESKSDQCEE